MPNREDVLVTDLRLEDGAIVLGVGNAIDSLLAVDRGTGVRREISFSEGPGIVILDLAELVDELPKGMARFDLFVRPSSASHERSGEEVRLRVREVQSLPVWERYVRGLNPRSATVPHMYINRGGSVSLVVRNPAFLDHGERQFRHRQELTALKIRGRSIIVEFALTVYEVGRFSVSRSFLKHQSNETFHEIDASSSSYSWHGQTLKGSFVIDLVPGNDPLPLRYALYVELLGENGQQVLVRLDHLSEQLFASFHRCLLAPRMLLDQNRVLSIATSPRTTLASFLVRPATISDTQRVRQRCFIAIARAEAGVRRILRRPRRAMALIFEKEAATAQDNGITLFDFLSHAEAALPFDVRFLMDRNSPQWARVTGRDGVIPKFSLAHWRAITSPTTFLASSETRYHAAHLYAQPSLLDRHVYVRKNYFLQHGVTGFTRVTIFDPALAIFPDYAVATAVWERDVLVDRGMPAENIDITGFARWDKLRSADARQPSRILYMPTWRDWLEGRSAKELLDTEYVRRITSLLSSPELHRLLTEHSARLAFLPHPKFKDLASALHDVSPLVDFIDQDRADFAAVVNEADIVITDYSSIAWEFVRSSKTALLYQFDRRAYEAKIHHSPQPALEEIMKRLASSEDEATLLGVLGRTLNTRPEHLLRENETLARAAFAFTDAQNSRRIQSAMTRRLPELCEPRVLPDYRTADAAYQLYLSETLSITDAPKSPRHIPRE